MKLKFKDVSAAESADIVIVGAGISGLYTAWRLIQNDPTLSITIVERLNRTGGRLDTDIVKVKEGEYVREEEGGMRFNYGMEELMNLNKALGLCDQIVDFPMSSEGDTNRFYVRGRNFTVAEAAASKQMIWSELYDLKTQEQGLSPTDLVTNAYKNVLYENGAAYKGGRPPEFWTRFREEFTWKGKTLNQWQLWGLLRDMNYSEECIEMLSDTIGFAGPFKGLPNAGDAFQILADFPVDPTYFTFERGFSTLPNAIVADLEANYAAQVSIYLSTNVDSIAPAKYGAFNLLLTEAPEFQNSNPFIQGGEQKTLHAGKLILAVATKGLENLFITSPALNARKDARTLWENIHASIGMKLMKINMYYNKPWWENGQTGRPSIQFGPNFTDLPINSVYPFYALPVHKQLLGIDDGLEAAPEIRDAAAALTIYCDFNNTNFWKGLQNVGPKFDSPLQQEMNNAQPQVMYAASQAIVDEAKRQFQLLFGANSVPDPVLTSYRLWNGEDDFEFAYHQWQLNVVDSEVRAYLSNPFENLYCCNEAISDMQGWVNGSLRSSNAALAHFGIGPLADDPCANPDAGLESTATPARKATGLWG